jgi:hypothetical protein
METNVDQIQVLVHEKSVHKLNTTYKASIEKPNFEEIREKYHL